MGSGSAVIVAAERPDLVRGLVLVGPFVRNGKTSAMQRFGAGWPWSLSGPRRRGSLTSPSFMPVERPADFEVYRDQAVASLRRPGYARAFSITTRTSHDDAEARLGDVSSPALIVMGEKDPDFANPKAEAEWIGKTLKGEVVMVPDAGHYPQSQRPDLVAPAVIGFLRTLGDRA